MYSPDYDNVKAVKIDTFTWDIYQVNETRTQYELLGQILLEKNLFEFYISEQHMNQLDVLLWAGNIILRDTRAEQWGTDTDTE